MNRYQLLGQAPVRKGCPRVVVPPCLVSEHLTERRTELKYNVVAMTLIHAKKNGKVKSSLSLKDIHLELEKHHLLLYQSGSANIAFCKVSFNCLIDGIFREYVTFDLCIPGTNTDERLTFCYNFVETMYGGKENLYDVLHYFYNLGRSCVNPDDFIRGCSPVYSKPLHGQFIRHSEQMLVAYLCHPQAALMLCNRLRTEIRSNCNASFVKVYSMILHIHSTKTCCGPCEYTLIGMMNSCTPFYKNDMQIGFIPNFIQACSVRNELLNFSFPQRSLFRFLTTVTGSTIDKDHRLKPIYEEALIGQQDVPNYEIYVRHENSTRHIYITLLDNSYTTSRLPMNPNILDKTTFISGSDATHGSPKTKAQVKSLRDAELDHLDYIPKFLFPSTTYRL